MIIKTDCLHFPGDRPCRFHKTEGVVCDTCTHYTVPQTRILIIKLDATGDVLRTTSVLHAIHETFPSNEITWITRTAAVPLFKNNALVHRVIAYESTEAQALVAVEQFDVLYNFDASFSSSVLAAQAKATKKFGYGIDTRGDVRPFNAAAEEWFEMGSFDHLKKKNTKTYQDHMLAVAELSSVNKEIIITLSSEEKAFAQTFAAAHGLTDARPKIGLNTGASDRWQFKMWTLDGFQALIRTFLQTSDALILLYGGPLEAKRNEELASIDPTRVINMGTNNTLREFFALVTLCDVFVTGDTLALHAATALGKKVLAYFGPTSVAEIADYNGRVTKVHADLDCLCCYKMTCDFQPNCMNSLTPEFMVQQVRALLPALSTHSMKR